MKCGNGHTVQFSKRVCAECGEPVGRSWNTDADEGEGTKPVRRSWNADDECEGTKPVRPSWNADADQGFKSKQGAGTTPNAAPPSELMLAQGKREFTVLAVGGFVLLVVLLSILSAVFGGSDAPAPSGGGGGSAGWDCDWSSLDSWERSQYDSEAQYKDICQEVGKEVTGD